MTNKEKKVILTVVGIMVGILLLVVVSKGINKKDSVQNSNKTVGTQNVEKYATNLVGGTKINNSGEFNKNKKYKNIEISDIQFTYKNGKSVLIAKLTNIGSTKQEMEIAQITIFDENSNILGTIEPIIPELNPGETKPLNATLSGIDSINAKDFKIEEK